MPDQRLLKFISAIRDSHPDMVELYTQGQCYNFFLIIRSLWPAAVAYYDHIQGHVYTALGGRLYDIRGVLPLPLKRYGYDKLSHVDGHRPHRWANGETRRLKEQARIVSSSGPTSVDPGRAHGVTEPLPRT